MLRHDLPIALPLTLFIDYDDAAGVDCDQTPADVGAFIVPFRCEVLLAGVVVTETCAGATTTPVVKYDKRPTAGSDTSRGDGDIATFVLSTTAAGKVMYDEAAVGTELNPGDEVIVELATQATGTGAAGHVRPFLLVEYLPETKANLAAMTAPT
jgi:hypothetical protein